MLSQTEEAKIQKLLDALEEMSLSIKRAMVTCEALEKELRGRLNA